MSGAHQGALQAQPSVVLAAGYTHAVSASKALIYNTGGMGGGGEGRMASLSRCLVFSELCLTGIRPGRAASLQS
jgi:hypothetical protein